MKRLRRGYCAAAYYAPSCLLIAVALVQIYLADVQNILTPWKGGGFGMFSTVDKLSTRLIHAYVINRSGKSRPIHLTSRTIRKLLRPCASLPTTKCLRSIAQNVAAQQSHMRSMKGVRIEVWKIGFDETQMQVKKIKVREFIWEQNHLNSLYISRQN